MPHSTITPAGHHSTNMHQPDQMTSAPTTKSSSIVASPDSQHSGQTPPKPWNRKSLPDSGISAESIGNTNIDEFLHKHLGSRESVMAACNGSSRQRTRFYEDRSHYNENQHGAVQERIQRGSPVIAELRTNVIIKDEFTLVTDLSYHLAARYTRPESALMIKIDHSACIAMGGSFEPCYILSLTAVPSQMGPTMNKRNATLIQSFLADILSVPPERGVIKFLPIPEENFGTKGTTIFGEIERQEKHQGSGEGGSGVRSAVNNSMGKKSFSKSKKTPAKESTVGLGAEEPRPATNRTDSAATVRLSVDKQGMSESQNAAITNTREVFELPATEMDKKRPVPAQSKDQVVSSNGLAMNGISSDAPQKTSKREKIRPRTISGDSPYTQNQIKSLATATAIAVPHASTGTPPKQTRPPSFLKVDPTHISSAKHKFHHRSRRQSTTATTTTPTTPELSRSRNSYSDNGNGTIKHANGEWTIIDHANKFFQQNGRLEAVKRDDGKDEGKKEDTEANTAKRRSTITAAPKVQEMQPAVASIDLTDAKSTKSMRLGKRKSFLAAFRRGGSANAQQVAAS